MQVLNVPVDEKKSSDSDSKDPSIEQHEVCSSDDDKALLPADAKRAFWLSTAVIIIISVIVPIPLGSSTYIFSPKFFTAWIVIAMVRNLRSAPRSPFAGY